MRVLRRAQRTIALEQEEPEEQGKELRELVELNTEWFQLSATGVGHGALVSPADLSGLDHVCPPQLSQNCLKQPLSVQTL